MFVFNKQQNYQIPSNRFKLDVKTHIYIGAPPTLKHGGGPVILRSDFIVSTKRMNAFNKLQNKIVLSSVE